MVIYFCDRSLTVLGQASTSLRGDYVITSDTKKEATETGVSSLDVTLSFTDDTRATIENWCAAGNYVLTYNGDEKTESKDATDFYMIVDTELSVTDRTINLYAENSGLDLLNNLAGEYTGTDDMNAGDYIKYFLEGTGFTLRNDTTTAIGKKLEWTSTETVTKRIQEIATDFDAELSYGFTVKGMQITERYVDVMDEVGTETATILYIDKQVNNITVKKTIENLATALFPTGKDSLNLKGYTIPEADKEKWQIDPEGNLVSLEALQKWKRYDTTTDESYTGNLYQKYEVSDCEDVGTLYELAKTKLESLSDVEVNYEVDIASLPQGIGIGDRVTIVDDEGNTYISGRILELETSVTSGTKTATLGEYIIESAGVSETVERLAEEFANIAKTRELYTWICYADKIDGTGISLDPEGKEYLGTATNQLTETVSLDDPSIFTFVKVKGEQGDDGVSPTVTTSKDGDTTTIAITDAEGIKTATITDGQNGDDGISPVVTLSTEDDGTTKIVVTDTEGEKSTTLEDAYARTVATAYITQEEGTDNIMVSNVDSTENKNNLLITDSDIQIRSGDTTVARYGESVVIGESTSTNLVLTDSTIKFCDGLIDALNISIDKGESEYSIEKFELDGSKILDAIENEYTYTKTVELTHKPSSIDQITAWSDDLAVEIYFGEGKSDGMYFNVNNKELKLYIDGPSEKVKEQSWGAVTYFDVAYYISKDATSVAECTALIADDDVSIVIDDSAGQGTDYEITKHLNELGWL